MSMEELEHSRPELTLASEPVEIGYWDADGETRPVLFLTKSMISLWNSIAGCVLKLEKHRQALRGELEDQEADGANKGRDPTMGPDGGNSAFLDSIQGRNKQELLQEIARAAADKKRVLQVRIRRAEEDLGICWRRLALDWTDILRESNLIESDLTGSLDKIQTEDGRKEEVTESDTSEENVTEVVGGNTEEGAELAAELRAEPKAGPEAESEIEPKGEQKSNRKLNQALIHTPNKPPPKPKPMQNEPKKNWNPPSCRINVRCTTPRNGRRRSSDMRK